MRQRHRDTREIAEGALELPPWKRDDFLSDRCGDDLEKRSRAELEIMKLNERMLGGGESTRPSTSTRPKLRTGDFVGDYEVLEELGRGGYGVVYKCRERSLGKLVALKMLLHGVERASAVEEFIEEGRRLALLNHVNVIHVHCAGMFGGRPFIVMEYLEGKTVRELLEAESPLSLSRALEIASQGARGLHEIHRQRLVHRDISARNLMVARDHTAKILDLGLSRFVDAVGSLRSGALAGVPMYLAPELFGGSPPSFASDIFSFGVLMYEMLAGANPFRESTVDKVIEKLLHHEPEPLDSRELGVPPRVARLVARCLEKSPSGRLDSLNGVAEQLQEIREGGDDGQVALESARRPSVEPQNPFLNRAMIRRAEDFVGRDREVRRVLTRLNANPPASISVVGDRRIGKSSLLNFVSMEVNRDAFFREPERTIVVFFDLQQGDLTLDAFLEAIVGSIRAQVDRRVRLPPVSNSLSGLKDVVKALAERKYRLVVLLDEFERMARNDTFSLDTYSFLRHLAGHYPVSWVTASVRPLQGLCRTREIAESPFFNFFHQMRLGPFSREEARSLITDPARHTGVRLDRFVDFVVDSLAGHLPMFVQIACSALFELIQEDPDGDIDLSEARDLFLEEAHPHFRFLWMSLDDEHRDVIRRLAAGKRVSPSLDHVEADLVDRGYARIRGELTRLFSDVFADYVRLESRGTPETRGRRSRLPGGWR